MKAFTKQNYKDLTVYECGKEQCVKDKAISLSVKKYKLFHYVVSGKGTLILNNKEYRISKGTIFYIPEQTNAIYFPDKTNPWFYEWIGFDGTKVKEVFENLLIDVDHPLIIDKKNKYKKYFDDIIGRFNERGFFDLFTTGSVYQLLSDISYDKKGKGHLTSSLVTIQTAKNYIDNNFQFDIDVVDIAKNANVSPNYLSALFKKEEGISTKSYLTKIRMEKAKDFLAVDKFKIKEVAKLVGYENQLHFSNEFKKFYGKSPLNYIKKGDNNEN